jgi:ParB-like chromosome segregation protein Spo0J
MKLQCKLITCNDAEAFTKSIAENRVRSKTTPMDDAHAQRELRERFGVPDKRIAAIYGKTTAHVSLLKKLMALSVENQERVHNGELSLVAGCELAELPETTQAEIVAEAVKATDLESAKVEVQPTSPTPVPTTQQANAPSGSAEAIDQSPKRPGRPRKSPEPPALPKPRQQNLSGKVLGAVKDAKAEAGQSFTRSRADLIAFLSSDFFAARAKPSNMGIAGLLISYLNGKLSDAALMENMNLLSGDD